MMKDSEMRCSQCLFSDQITDFMGDKTLICRRFPPVVMDYVENVFPIIGDEDWCGEFSRRTPE